MFEKEKEELKLLTNNLKIMFESDLQRPLTEIENLILNATYIKAVEDAILNKINTKIINGEVHIITNKIELVNGSIIEPVYSKDNNIRGRFYYERSKI